MFPVSIYIDKLYKYDLIKEPCAVAVPFAKGELQKEQIGRLAVWDAAHQEVPATFRATSTWQDGSIKYLFVRLAADLPANKNVQLTLSEQNASPAASKINTSKINTSEFSSTSQISGHASAASNTTDNGQSCNTETNDPFTLTISEEDTRITVDTGCLKFTVENGKNSLFQALLSHGRTYTAEQFLGPVLKYNGQERNIVIEHWKIEEKNPLCCILEGAGKYSETYRVTVRITAFSGKDYLDLAFRLFNDTEEELVPDSWNFYLKRTAGEMDEQLAAAFDGTTASGTTLNGMAFGSSFDSTGCGDKNESVHREQSLAYRTTGTGELEKIENEIRNHSVSGIRTMTGSSNYKTTFTISGEGETLCSRITAKMLVGEANEHFAEVLYGTFFADVCDENGGVCATVFQAHQNFPKALKACAEGLCIYLIPECDEKVHFSAGMAREQRIQLHFHTENLPIEELDNRSLIYQMPIVPRINPACFDRANVFPNVVTKPENVNNDVELAMIARADQHGRAYGMMNWGDFPDENYTTQGRGGGRLVWSNNEYDYPHAMFMMYARSGERRFFDYAKTAALHWMDVDVCHYNKDPLAVGGQWEHTACHNGGNFLATGVKGVMVCSHEWVEGLLDLWHFSGDRRAYDTAVGIGDNILRLLDTPMYQKPGEANARETGWALRSLIALYLETNDEKWITKSRFIIEQFRLWKEKYGAWLAPYTDNTVIRVGFMISVAIGSLMRYYRVFPEPDVKELILSAVDDLLENARNPFGLFYYKELPSLRRNGNNTLLLESMYIGYELTGDTKYLKAGLPTFRNNIDAAFNHEGTKRIVEDAVLVGKTSPKSFAQSFLPLIQFYNAAAAEHLL